MNKNSRNKSNSNNKRGNNQKRRPNTKGYGKSNSCDDDDLKSKTNDPQWYAASPAILRDAASIPFSWAVGTPIDMGGSTKGLFSSDTHNEFFVPGIQTMTIVPSIGYTSGATSPINVAATATYSFVRHANSGHANYDSPDLMLYLLAMSQVYSAINWLMRIYGCATLYAQRNRYLPQALLAAQRCKADDIMSHLADFRYGINVLISKAASLAVPASMTIFQRHAFLYQNIYTEGTSIKDQLYMYVPAGFWKFGYSPVDSAGELGFSQLTSSSMTVQSLIDYVNGLLTPILESEDMNIMSGDVLKAYGDGGIIKLQALNEVYPITPIFDIAVLEQMKNATIINVTPQTCAINQNSNHQYLSSNPRYLGDAEISDATVKDNMLYRWTENRLLTTTTSEVTPELVIESTRLMVSGEYVPAKGEDAAYVRVYSGSEICISCTWWTYDWDTFHENVTLRNYAMHEMQKLDSSYWTSPTSINNSSLFLGLATMSHFRFHPCMRIWITSSATGKTVSQYGTFFDVDNYAVLHSDTIKRLHEAALMNMLAVPSIAKL